jgi:hypothetical protein
VGIDRLDKPIYYKRISFKYKVSVTPARPENVQDLALLFSAITGVTLPRSAGRRFAPFSRQWGRPKVVQELLRHSSIKVTMEIYRQALTSEKRKAQSEGGGDDCSETQTGGRKCAQPVLRLRIVTWRGEPNLIQVVD